MTIVRLDPFREFRRCGHLRAEQHLDAAGRHLPDERHELVLKAELPDMTREDIESPSRTTC